MTAFASRSGSLGPVGWSWDLRGVNGRGLELRLRLPDGVEGLEAEARKRLAAALTRGNVTLALKLARSDAAQGPTLDNDELTRVLDALDAVQTRAVGMGVTLGQPTAADVLAQRGVLTHALPETDTSLVPALLTDLDRLIGRASCRERVYVLV